MSHVVDGRRFMQPSTRLAIQAGISALAAILFVNLVSIERPYWVVLTAIVVMVGSAGETLAKSIDRTLGTLFGLVAGLTVYWIAALIDFPDPLLLIFAVPAIAFLKFASYRLMVAAITAAVVLLLELAHVGETLILSRLSDTAIGAVIAVATSFLILRIPTRRPVQDTIDAYNKALAVMVHDALHAVINGQWNADIEKGANRLRESDADFERLATALHAESKLIGGDDIPRTALAVLPVLRGHVDMIIEAAKAATSSGLGDEIAEQLAGIDRQIATNLDAVRDALTSGRPRDVPKLDPYYRSIEKQLLPKLRRPDTRQQVVEMLNVLLALRRLNRSLRHAMASLRS